MYDDERRRFLRKNKKFHLYAVRLTEYMAGYKVKLRYAELTRYGRVNIRKYKIKKRNNERADNRHEKTDPTTYQKNIIIPT